MSEVGQGRNTMKAFLNVITFVVAVSSIGFLIAAERSYQHSFSGSQFIQSDRLS
jgi:hypothetical protein